LSIYSYELGIRNSEVVGQYSRPKIAFTHSHSGSAEWVHSRSG